MLTSGESREPTWAERERMRQLRDSGVQDIYCEIDQADAAFWQSLLIAVHWHVLGENGSERYWDAWYAEFRYAFGLPESSTGYKHYLFKQVVTNGRYQVGQAGRIMTAGQRLSAVEHLIDVLDRDVSEFAEALNERAVHFRVGIKLVGRRFVSVTSEHMHQEVTVRTLLLLSDQRFAVVDGLYRKAFDRALAGDHGGAITAATSSVEEMLRIGLGETNGQLQPLLQKARTAGWIIPAVEQIAVKLAALRSESDAHTAGTDDPNVALLAVHTAAALLIHLGATAPAPLT